jgi:hypothetical protein
MGFMKLWCSAYVLSRDRYVVFKDENNIQIVVDSNQVKKDQSNVLKRYNIRSSKSDDLTK